MPGAGYSPGQDFDADMPSGSTVGYDADNDVRDNQGHVDNAYAVEHYAPSNDPDASEDDFGRHDFITLKEQAAKPSLAGSTNRHALYAKAAGLYVEDESGDEILLVSFGTPSVAAFPATTVMLFGQNSAPTGWTRVTTWTDGGTEVDGCMLCFAASGNPADAGARDPRAAHTHVDTLAAPPHDHDVVLPNNNTTPGGSGAVNFAIAQTLVSGGASATALTGSVGNDNALPYYAEVIAASKD